MMMSRRRQTEPKFIPTNRSTSSRGPINRSKNPPSFREKINKNSAEKVQVHAGQNLRVMGRLSTESKKRGAAVTAMCPLKWTETL